MLSRKTYALAAAAVFAVLYEAHPALAAYSMSTVVAVPFTAVDPASNLSTTYTSLSVPSGVASNLPNGNYLGNSTIVVGTLAGYNSNSTSANNNVSSAFAYDATNGFRIIGNYTTNSIGTHGSVSVRGTNTVGQVIGNSGIYDPTSSYFGAVYGQSAWLYTTGGSTVNIGLAGANLSYAVAANTTNGTAAGTYSYNQADLINSTGQVAGYTNRYQGVGSTPTQGLGKSAWLYSGGTTSEIGLFGAGYSYAAATAGVATGRYSSNTAVNITNNGQVAGNATAYVDRNDGTGAGSGQDGWVYSPAAGTTTAIGLYNSGASVTGTGLTNASYTVMLAQSMTGSTTVNVPYRSTTVTGISNGGFVAGTSVYYKGTSSTAGTDAFVYNSNTGSYTQVGLTANNYTATNTATVTSYVNGTAGARSSAIPFINNLGRSAGTSTRYNVSAAGASLASGTDAWTADASGNVTRVGLYDTLHSFPTGSGNYAGLATEAVTAESQTGLVAGTAARFASTDSFSGTLGIDAWVYDSNTSTTYTLNYLTNPSATSYQYSQVLYLSDTGDAAGIFKKGTSSSAPNFAFVWSPTGGFVDLGANVSPSLTAAGWASLITGYYTNGSVTYATANTTASGTAVAGIVAITSTPEPASLSMLALGATAMIRRRRSMN